MRNQEFAVARWVVRPLTAAFARRGLVRLFALRRRLTASACSVSLFVVAAGDADLASGQTAPPPSSSNQESPSGLTQELLEGLSTPSQPSDEDSLHKRATERERMGGGAWTTLVDVARAMQDAARSLAVRPAADEIQEQQLRIIVQLDELIEQVESQQSTSSAVSSATAAAPSASDVGDGESTRPNGTRRGSQDPLFPDSLGTVWGHLPERLQQQIQSPLREDFLPAYRSVITEYYKRLAEQRRR